MFRANKSLHVKTRMIGRIAVFNGYRACPARQATRLPAIRIRMIGQIRHADTYFVPRNPNDINDLLRETKFLELEDLSRTLEGRIREYSSSNL